MRNLKIADNLTLPVEAVTQTFAVLAKRRVGKTYTASVMAEEMVKAGLPFVALDPTGAWWGLRASADGKSEGLPVIIIGGAHGDLPLEATAGGVIAELVVENPNFYVIDLSGTESDAQQDRFATDFAKRLYRLKDKHRDPLHLFIDEADCFAPQRPFEGQKAMLGAFEALVRRGGIRGIGMTLITQRPAVLNKNVLNMTEVIIALQTTAPLDQDAVEDWVKRNGSPGEVKRLMNSLASLKQGEAWFYSPAWLEEFKLINIRQRETFNSSATPKVGEKRIEPQRLASVDLDRLRNKIADTIEKVKANDPSELKRQIAELKKQIGQTPRVEEKRVEVAVLSDSQIAGGLELAARMERTAGELIGAAKELTANLSRAPSAQTAQRPPVITQSRPARVEVRQAPDSGNLGSGERKILTALAQYPQGRTKIQVATLTGYSHKGGGFNNYISGLRAKGYIEGGNERLAITHEGLEVLGDYEPLPTGQPLVELWMSQVSKAERGILQAVIDAFPAALTKEEVAERAGYEASGGGFNNAVSRLRTLELIEGKRELRASENFFA